MGASLAERVVAGTPALHSGGQRRWNALPDTLRLLERLAPVGGRTIETGAGASTIVLGGVVRSHLAITPNVAEHAAIRRFAAGLGVDMSGVRFVGEPSEVCLPRLPSEPRFDMAFIDGRHSFPTPVVDYAYVSRLLRVGGLLVLDDVPIPSVRMVYEHCASSTDWRVEQFADDRSVVLRKLRDEVQADVWRQQGVNRRWPNYSYLPARVRLPLIIKARAKQVKKSVVASRIGDGSRPVLASRRRDTSS